MKVINKIFPLWTENGHYIVNGKFAALKLFPNYMNHFQLFCHLRRIGAYANDHHDNLVIGLLRNSIKCIVLVSMRIRAELLDGQFYKSATQTPDKYEFKL